jgi:hypothetical protein
LFTVDALPGESPDLGKITGWVEVIVRDKDGRIKYIYAPPERVREIEEEEGRGRGNSILSSIPASFLDYYWRKNIITNSGLAAIIRLIAAGLSEAKFSHLAIGTGTNPESPGDTALQQEIRRKPATITQVTTTVPGDTALFEATFSSADGLQGSHTVSEAGIFNAPTGGILLARKVFPGLPLNWDTGDSITIRYFIQMTR